MIEESLYMVPMELSVLIPTYNEADIILIALKEIEMALGSKLSSQTEILIMDDGTDTLDNLVRENASNFLFGSVQVYRNNPKLGKGKSLALGFQKAQGEIVGFLDADLSTPPRYIHQATQLIKSGQADIFIASRRAKGSVVNRQQSMMKDILGHLLGVVAGKIIFYGMRNYRDTQCGFKFYKNAAAKLLYKDLVAPDGLNDIEVLIRANLMDYSVFEQGVEWTDLRESKRSLRRILWGEIVAISHILVKYKLFASKRRQWLHNMADKLTIL